MLVDAADELGRHRLTYLGLPGREAKDVLHLGKRLQHSICVDVKQDVLDACSTQLARLSLETKLFVHSDMWEYLRTKYPAEPLFADIAFLDFCGGGIQSHDPFATEIAGLRAFLAKQAKNKGRAFVLAWTYMPHDKGPLAYQAILETLKLSSEDEALIKGSKGVDLRSISIRLLLRQSFREHGMRARVYHHARYKKSMNTIILIVSSGQDDQCGILLEEPEAVVHAPIYCYDDKGASPSVGWLTPQN